MYLLLLYSLNFLREKSDKMYRQTIVDRKQFCLSSSTAHCSVKLTVTPRVCVRVRLYEPEKT